MNELLKKLYRQMLVRSAWGTGVLVPLLVLYVLALISLNGSQIKATLLALALVAPALFIGYTLQSRINMRPIERVLGQGRTDAESLRAAEQRSLSLPYFILASAVGWFTLGGGVIGGILVWQRVLRPEEGLYILGCGATGGAIAGIMGYYYAKAPLRDILIQLWQNREVELQPPVFVPLRIKLVTLFTLTMLLTVTFLGFVTYQTLRQAVERERAAAWREKTELLAAAAEATRLGSAVANGQRFCVIAADDWSGCDLPAGSNLAQLQALAASAAPTASAKLGGWEWTARRLAPQRWLLAGRNPVADRGGAFGFGKFSLKALLVVLVVGIGLGVLVASDLTDPLAEMSAQARAIAERGDRDPREPVGSEDETGTVARTFRRMTGALTAQLDRNRQLLSSIQSAVGKLSEMSQQLVSYLEQQATANLQQSAAAEQTATTCEEISATARQIAESAAAVAASSREALGITQDGAGDVRRTRESFDGIARRMREISAAIGRLGENSRMIEGMVRIIEEISDQINLLALNAALEAAGAGPHGARFGVVAREIHNLAGRANESTAIIRDIVGRMEDSISQSTQSVGEGEKTVLAGGEVVQKTARSFDDILQANTRAAARLEQIDRMSTQQRAASEQMARSSSQVSQTAGALVEEVKLIRSAMVELNEIVTSLREVVASGGEKAGWPNRPAVPDSTRLVETPASEPG